MSLRAVLWLMWMALVFGATGGHAVGDTFTATYNELARSPANYAASWYSGAVTRDGRFIYGLGNSHNAYGNNGIWLYDPATNTHQNLFPNVGSKWLWKEDANKQVIRGSGHWASLDPVSDRALYEFFGGPTIQALTNRNNHQAFYVAARNEFWVLAGTTFYQDAGKYFAGRFDLGSRRWVNISATLAEFSAGLIAGLNAWVAPNAATAVCPDIDSVVLFGGMNGTGGVLVIEPNPAGPEPYRAVMTGRPPVYQPVENVRHNAVGVGEFVYFVEGQRRIPNVSSLTTPDPADFWRFHVPTRTWDKLRSGPPGGYFGVLTHDPDAHALLLYGGSASNRLWVYDLLHEEWHDLTGTIPNLPRADMHTGGFIPGFGHVYKGGRRFDTSGKEMDYTASSMMMRITLKRERGAGDPTPQAPAPSVGASTTTTAQSTATKAPEGPRTIIQRVLERQLEAAAAAPVKERAQPLAEAAAAPVVPPADQPARPRVPMAKSVDKRADSRARMSSPVAMAAGVAASATTEHASSSAEKTAVAPADPPVKQRARSPVPANRPADSPRKQSPKAAALPELPPIPGGAITWVKLPFPLPIPGLPRSPQGEMKHQRLVEGPGGRVYILGGDWGGPGGEHTGRQEVFSFDPLSPLGDWRLEAPYCGTKEHPVHWHTDEAGVAWDAKRGVFWKLAGTEYGPGMKDPSQDPCLAAGGSVKAKVITFDPASGLWSVPPGIDQKRFGYVTNGVLDPDKDELVQIIDKAAMHLSLTTGQWTSHALPGDVLRFNAIAARVGRDVYWCNRKQVLESYNLDTHRLTTHSVAPWPVPAGGWEMQMVMPYGDRVLVVRPTSRTDTPRHAALYDPATRQWTTLDMGPEARGNTGMMHSSGKLILMGGGIDGPEHQNKFVWVGDLP